MKTQNRHRWLLLAGVAGLLLGCVAGAHALEAQHVAIVVNADDANSAALGEHYRKARGIARQRVFTLHLGRGESAEPAVFMYALARLQARLPDVVQGFALAWLRPWRVDCMSITSAFAFGYDRRHCAEGCRPTAPSPLFNSASDMPWRDLGVRPAMLLAGATLGEARALVERGVAADGSRPRGTAYLVSTDDAKRNVRAAGYADIALWHRGGFEVVRHAGNRLDGRDDVMFYFTGLARVPGLRSNRFLPGAIGDHLTSYGGRLQGARQMSVLRWLEAGATGSFGTVIEPCAFVQKFPDPAIVMRRYLAGESLLMAYWKSVRWPGQGLFVGEPLARPFAPR